MSNLRYFPSKYKGNYFFDNPKEVETSYYDKFTGKPLTGGTAFKETKHFNDACQCTLLELYYNHPPINLSKWERLFEGDNLMLERQITYNKIYETEYVYNSLSVLEEERTYSFSENKKHFTEGIKYTYEYIAGNWRVVRKDKIFTGRDGEIISILKGQYEYDDLGRIKTEISPISIHDLNFDPHGKLIVSRKYLDLDIIEVEEKYSTKPMSVKKYYYKVIDKLIFYASVLEVAKEINVDNQMNIISRAGFKYGYELDQKHNWIKKFDGDVLVEERRIVY